MGFLGVLAPMLATVIDRVIPDTGERDRVKAELHAQLIANAATMEQAAARIIQAEAQSEHQLAAIWRPLLALVCVAIVANNFILAPYVALFAGVDVTLPLPPEIWNLMNLCVGGYVASRGAEKVARIWKEGGGRG
jgi:hypothetical protein